MDRDDSITDASALARLDAREVFIGSQVENHAASLTETQGTQ